MLTEPGEKWLFPSREGCNGAAKKETREPEGLAAEVRSQGSSLPPLCGPRPPQVPRAGIRGGSHQRCSLAHSPPRNPRPGPAALSSFRCPQRQPPPSRAGHRSTPTAAAAHLPPSERSERWGYKEPCPSRGCSETTKGLGAQPWAVQTPLASLLCGWGAPQGQDGLTPWPWALGR